MIRLIVTAMVGWVAMGTQAAWAQDKLYLSEDPEMAEFNARPMWANAARCAAYDDMMPELIQRPGSSSGQAPASRNVVRDEGHYQLILQRARDRRAYWARFGLARLNRDRPGQAATTLFEAQAARDLAEHRRLARNEGERERFEAVCANFRQAIEWNLVRMERGWAD